MPEINILCHLWDLVDGDLDAALDTIQGRIGASGITVPLTAGVIRHLRMTPAASPRWFTSRGGVFFQPERERYAATRCGPVMSDWLRGRNPISAVAQRCRERGLGLRARLECTNLGRIAERYPLASRKNVFGDPSPSQLCLINPDVNQLIRALAQDIRANYGIETLELTGLDAMWPPAGGPFLELGDGARQLMALCYCESCRQVAGAAGLEVEAARRSTLVRLERLFRTGQPIASPLLQLAADDMALAPFIAWYRACIGKLFNAIRGEGPCRLGSLSRPLRAGDDLPADAVYVEGADFVILDHAGIDTEAIGVLARAASNPPESRHALELQLKVAPCFMADPQALVRNVNRAAELGLATTLDCYGHLPADGFEVVKQAVRFALRSAAVGVHR